MKPGTIIILNGTSSSGKTTLLKLLQTELPEPYLNAGIDKFLWMLPGRYLDRPLWDEVLGLATTAGAVGHQLMSGMHQSWRTLSQSGNHLLADHVLVEPQWVAECATLLADLPAYFIGVYWGLLPFRGVGATGKRAWRPNFGAGTSTIWPGSPAGDL